MIGGNGGSKKVGTDACRRCGLLTLPSFSYVMFLCAINVEMAGYRLVS